jgi:hypothetical protein
MHSMTHGRGFGELRLSPCTHGLVSENFYTRHVRDSAASMNPCRSRISPEHQHHEMKHFPRRTRADAIGTKDAFPNGKRRQTALTGDGKCNWTK